MSYRDLVMADLRLVVLRLLADDADYQCNSSILQMAVEEFGHRVSRDQLHTELAWLAEQGLMTVSEIASVRVAKLTTRGLDVAQGRVVQPGVKRPGPG